MEVFTRVARRLRRRLNRTRDQGGFTLVEMMVAQGIILASLMTIAFTATVGFADIAHARQRQGANGLANELIEQVRSLPFDAVKRGLSNADLAVTDPAISSSGCPAGVSYCYRASAAGTLEEIPRGNNPSISPIVPHRGTVVIGQTTYTRAVYVTVYNNDPTLNAFRVTAVVSWTNAARRGVDASVTAQTVMFSPGGAATATHPFVAPAQPFFYGAAQIAPGHVDVTGSLPGGSLSAATLWLPSQSSSMQIEQVAAVQGSVTTAGATVALEGSAKQSVGRQSAASSADNDPTQPASEYSSASAGGSATTLSTGGSNAVTLSVGTGSTGATISTTAAGTARPCGGELDGHPCGRSTSSQGSSSGTLGLDTGYLNLSTMNLISVASSTSTGTTDRDLDATGDGRIVLSGTRAIGEVRAGGLPLGLSSLLVPLGWQGYLVRLNGYADSVAAETGVNTAEPVVQRSGTLSVWNGAGYTSVALTPGVGVDVPVTGVVIQDPLSPGGLLRIAMSATLRTGSTAVASTSKSCTPTPCVTTRTAASAAAQSPIVLDLTVTVTHAGNTISDVAVHVDLGSLEASGTYTEAPSA